MTPPGLPAAATSTTNGSDVDVLVIGGGLAGLVAAYRSVRVLIEHPRGGVITENDTIKSVDEVDSLSSLSTNASNDDAAASPKVPSLVVLEARHRLGGRISAVGGVDLGGTWMWPADISLYNLTKHLGVELYSQPAKGDVMVEQRGQIQRTPGEGESICGSEGMRFEGTATTLIDRLRERLLQYQAPDTPCHVEFVTGVAAKAISTGLAQKRTIVEAQRVGADGEDSILRFNAKVVIVAAPPRVVVKTIAFSPPLDPEKKAAMMTCPTGMADAAKIVAHYSRPLWREKKLSGTCFMASGPMNQIWDASDEYNDVYALAGFAFGLDATDLAARRVKLAEVDGFPATAFDCLPPVMKRAIDQLVKLVGSKPDRISWKSWQDEPWTGAGLENRSRGRCGHPDLRRSKDGSIIFAGSETEPEDGHLEGAVLSGNRAAIEVFELLGAQTLRIPPK